jgi:hypothetical protein
MANEFQEGVMHKQSHQNTHPTFRYRKGRIFYFRRKTPSDLTGGINTDGSILMMGVMEVTNPSKTERQPAPPVN